MLCLTKNVSVLFVVPVHHITVSSALGAVGDGDVGGAVVVGVGSSGG